MEHDDELKIRNKVRAYESTPIVLNKAHIWSALALPGQPKQNRYAIYLAAASLFFSAGMIFYTLELTYRKELELRMSEIELRLVQPTPTTVVLNPPVQEEACPEVAKPLSPSYSATRKTRQSKQQADAKVETTSIPSTTESVAVVSPEKMVMPGEPVASETAANETSPLVHSPSPVILGTSLSPSTSSKQGRFTFRLFRDEDTKNVPGPTPPPVTLASINN